MSRLRTNHVIVVAEDSTELEIDFNRPETDDEITDGYDEAIVQRFLLQPSVTFTVPFGLISNGGLIIVETDQEVSVVFNPVDGAPSFTVTPQPNAAVNPQTDPPTMNRARWFMMTNNISGMTVANNGSVVAKVSVVVAGSTS